MARCIARGVCFRRPRKNPELSVLLIYERGRWRLPGGHLEPDETNQDAVVREFREETNLDVEPKGKFFVHREITQKDEKVIETFLFVRIVGGELTQRMTDQGRSPDWFSIERLPRRMAWHYVMPIRKAAERMMSRERRV